MVDFITLVRTFIDSLQIVQQFGLLGIFFIYMIPSVFLIAEGVIIAAVVSGVPTISIIIFAAIGGTIGDLFWYYLGYYSYRKIKKIESKDTVKIIKHYKKFAFLYSSFPGGEILMVYAGIRHYHIPQILPFIVISNTIRASLAVGITIGVINNLPEIIRQIIF
jgi:membrane protein YqaA with SNARE-associated domain